MKDPRISQFAQILVDYSTRVKKDDVVFSGTIEGAPVTYTFSPLFGNGGVPARLYYP